MRQNINCRKILSVPKKKLKLRSGLSGFLNPFCCKFFKFFFLNLHRTMKEIVSFTVYSICESLYWHKVVCEYLNNTINVGFSHLQLNFQVLLSFRNGIISPMIRTKSRKTAMYLSRECTLIALYLRPLQRGKLLDNTVLASPTMGMPRQFRDIS